MTDRVQLCRILTAVLLVDTEFRAVAQVVVALDLRDGAADGVVGGRPYTVARAPTAELRAASAGFQPGSGFASRLAPVPPEPPAMGKIRGSPRDARSLGWCCAVAAIPARRGISAS
jgi:hypothetical protein